MSKSRPKMCKLVYLLVATFLLNSASSQGCPDTHSVSTWISYSIHGPSVNDLIGADTFNNIVKGASAAFTQSSNNQKVGVVAFGGNGVGQLWVRQGLTTGDGATVATAIDNSVADYSNNYGNVASAAISTANTALQTENGRQKYHVIFSATIPLANGFSSTTKPSNLDDICSQAIISKRYGM